jgi:hypothetical protein
MSTYRLVMLSREDGEASLFTNDCGEIGDPSASSRLRVTKA